MLGDLLALNVATGANPVVASGVVSTAQTVQTAKGGSSSTPGSKSAASPLGPSGMPTWNTAYATSAFTNNNLGNNGPDPNMQATLNDPHAAILAPPAPPAPVSAGTITTQTGPAVHPGDPLAGGSGAVTGPGGNPVYSVATSGGARLPNNGSAGGPTGITEPGDPIRIGRHPITPISSVTTNPTTTQKRYATAYARYPNNVVSKGTMVV